MSRHAALRRAVEARFLELGHALEPLTPGELVRRFRRRHPVADGIHYVLELAGVPIAYSIWLASADVEAALDGEAETLRLEGHVTVRIVNLFDGDLVLRSEMLAADAGDGAGSLKAGMSTALLRAWGGARAAGGLRRHLDSDSEAKAVPT